MKAHLLSDLNPALSRQRHILAIPAEGSAPRLFMEWQAVSFVELNEVWVIIEGHHLGDLEIVQDEPCFFIRFKTTGFDPTPLYESARDYINDNL